MKKSFIVSLVFAVGLCLSQIDSFAQYQRGDVIINPGVGLGYWYGGGTYATGFAAGISVNAEFSCILDEIAIGPYLAVTRRSYDIPGDDYNTTFIDFGVRGSYHFAKLLKVNTDQFDPYAGAMLGFVAVNDDYDGTGYDPYDGRVQIGLYAGARWYFSDRFGAFGEVGVGVFPVTLGLTFKVK